MTLYDTPKCVNGCVSRVKNRNSKVCHAKCANLVWDQTHANYVVRCRVGADGLSVRTITPPTTIAHQSAVSHGSHTHVVTSFPLASNSNIEATTIAQRTRPSVIVATISLPFASHATTHPTNIDAMTCPIAIPSVAKNT